MENIRIILGIALAFLVLVAVVGYVVRRGAGERSRSDPGGDKKDRRVR